MYEIFRIIKHRQFVKTDRIRNQRHLTSTGPALPGLNTWALHQHSSNKTWLSLSRSKNVNYVINCSRCLLWFDQGLPVIFIYLHFDANNGKRSYKFPNTVKKYVVLFEIGNNIVTFAKYSHPLPAPVKANFVLFFLKGNMLRLGILINPSENCTFSVSTFKIFSNKFDANRESNIA